MATLNQDLRKKKKTPSNSDIQHEACDLKEPGDLGDWPSFHCGHYRGQTLGTWGDPSVSTGPCTIVLR